MRLEIRGLHEVQNVCGVSHVPHSLHDCLLYIL